MMETNRSVSYFHYTPLTEKFVQIQVSVKKICVNKLIHWQFWQNIVFFAIYNTIHLIMIYGIIWKIFQLKECKFTASKTNDK